MVEAVSVRRLSTLQSKSVVAAVVSDASPLQFNPIDVSKHGVLPGNADNGPALIALRDALIAENRNRRWVLYFPRSLTPYKYSNNRWLQGLTDYKVSAYGAIFQNIHSGTFNGWDSMPLPQHMNSIWTTKGDFQGLGGMGFTSGERVYEALAGSATVTLQDVTDIATFGYQVGGTVLVHSFNQQGGGASAGQLGFPPNLRYFEYRKIAAINGATLTLDAPLAENHREDFPDWGFDLSPIPSYGQPENVFFGKPRVVNLTGRPLAWGDPLHYPDHAEIVGATWLTNPNFPGQTNALIVHGRDTRLEDVYVEGEIFPTGSETYSGKRLTATREIEVDKTMHRCTLVDCSSGTDGTQEQSLFAGTGCNYVTIVNHAADGRMSLTAQKELRVTGGSATSATDSSPDDANSAPIELFGGTYGGDLAIVNSVDAAKKANQAEFLMGYLGQVTQQFTVPGVSGNKILIARDANVGTPDEVFPHELKSIRPGSAILDDSDLSLIATVDRIVESNPGGYFEIWLNVVTAMPTVSQVVRYTHFKRVVFNENEFYADPTA